MGDKEEALIEDLTTLFSLLSDRSRLKTVLALVENESMHVKPLCKLVGQTQPAMSHHLSLMRLAGLVKFKREGKENHYYLADDFLRDLLARLLSANGNKDGIKFHEYRLLNANKKGG